MPNNPTVTQMRGVFPRWSASQLAAYRLGTSDPEGEHLGKDEKLFIDEYAFYLRGRADRIGDSAMYEDWFMESIPEWRVDTRWWL